MPTHAMPKAEAILYKNKSLENTKNASQSQDPNVPYSLRLPLRFHALPCQRNLVTRILRPPKLEHNLDPNLPAVQQHCCEHCDKGEFGMFHQETEDPDNIFLVCLLPQKTEHDGQDLQVDAIEEARSTRVRSKRRDWCLGSIVLEMADGRSDERSEALVVVASHDRRIRIARRSRRQNCRRGCIGSGWGWLRNC